MSPASRPDSAAPVVLDLRGAHLRDQDLPARAWQAADLVRADLSGARLDGSDLRAAHLHGARLRNASLRSVRASGCMARDLDGEGADLSGADLDQSDLQSAILLDLKARGANLRGARLAHADLRGADLRDADLRDADLRWADLSEAVLDNAQLEGVRAGGARLGPRLAATEAGAALTAAGAEGPRSRSSRRALSRRGLQVGADVARVGERRLAALSGQLRSLGRGAREELQRQLDEARVLRERRRGERAPRPSRSPAPPRVAPPPPAATAPRPARSSPQDRRAAERAALQARAGTPDDWGAAARARQEAADEAARRVLKDQARREEERRRREAELARKREEAAAARAQEAERRRQEEAAEARRRQEAEAEQRQREEQEALQLREAAEARQRDELSRQHAEERRQEEEARKQREEAERRQREEARLRREEAERRQREEERRQQEEERRLQEAQAQRDRLRLQQAEARQREAERRAREAEARAQEQARRDEEARLARIAAEQQAEEERAAQAAAAQEAAARIRARERAARATASTARTGESAALLAQERRRQEALAREQAELEAARQRAAQEQAEAERARAAQAEAAQQRAAEERARVERLRAEADRARAEAEAAATEAAQQAERLREAEQQRLAEAQRRRELEASRRPPPTTTSPTEPSPTATARLRLGLQVREQTRRARWSHNQHQRAQDGPVPQHPAPAPAASPPPEPAPPRRPWLAWLRGTPPPELPVGAGAQLEGADLRGLRLDKREWPEASLAGADLSSVRMREAVLHRADLTGATLESARLSGADLSESNLTEAILDGSRLRLSGLQGACLRRARLVDADLRGADLTGADLRDADLTGADLRQTRLDGADLTGANLSAARLSDLDLADACLDGALLDQADLAGTDFSRASLDQTDLSGALGLSGRDREQLARAGARTRDEALDQLVGRVASRQVRTAAAVLAIGVGAYLGARFLAASEPDPAALESLAEEQREVAPLAAASTYEELARSSQRLGDRVGYLLEAAALAERGGARDQAGRLIGEALEEAGDDPALGTDVRLRAARLHAAQGEWTELMVMVEPVLRSGGLPVDLRARAMVLYRMAAAEAGVAPVLADELLAELAEIPESEADLRMAIADIRSAEGNLPAALAELDRVAELELSDEVRLRALEARARILDRDGQSGDAAAAWAALMEAAPSGSPTWQAARLALADLRHRMGETAAARTLVSALLDPATDDRIRARALLVDGRLLEQEGDTEAARTRFQDALEIDGVEPETREEARMSLARLLLGSGDEAAIAAALDSLPPEARDGILLHARLGEARSLLDQGRAAAALDVYETILDGAPTDRSAVRAARAGQAECLATMGQLTEAVAIWRAQLADDPTEEERAWLELQLAHGLLQGGDTEEARSAFASLSASADADTRDQGALGLAEVARRAGERERARSLYEQVARRATDAAFQVQAWQELADMAVEDGEDEAAQAAWRGVLGAVAPGSPAAAEARMALMLHLAQRGDLERAVALCEETLASAAPPQRGPAHLACGELLERGGQPQRATEHYQDALSMYIPSDQRADAALGLARLHTDAGRAGEAADVLASTLAQVEAAELRLPLLSARIQALDALAATDSAAAAEREDARAEQRSLVSAAPSLAGPVLLDAAQRARAAGNTDEAVSLFEEAAALPADPAWTGGVRIELGDTLLADGQASAAAAAYASVLSMELAGDDPSLAFAAGMGAASALAQQGDPEGAVEQLLALEPPDARSRQWWLESQAAAHQQAGDMEAALGVWTELVERVDQDPAALAGGLRGRADALLALDRPEEALTVFQEAQTHTSDPSLLGWLRLGEAASLRESGQQEAALALLSELSGHADPEVQLQARIRRAQAFSAAERWQDALAEIADVGAAALGPGWDATLAETRAGAWTALGELERARAEWQRLARAWPDEEEALLPAWLGLAHVAVASGDEDRARVLASRALDGTEDPVYRAQALALMADLPPE